MDLFESARQRLQQLAAQEAAAAPRNEATTRLGLIDPLLMDCLGWEPEEIAAEDYAEGKWADYVVGRPAARLVVEAKREGTTFRLPVGVGDRIVDLPTLLQDRTVDSVVRQVLEYCRDRSIPIAVATNGDQLIAFLASRQDAVRPLEGRALVFRSLDDMLESFSELWDALSPAGVAEASLQRLLGASVGKPAPPRKLSARVNNYPGFRPRSEQETDLKILGQLFLLDIGGEREVSDDFLRSCYLPSGALSQYAMVSREILRTRYALVEEQVSEAEPVQTKKGVTAKLSPALLASALSRRPVLLLGDVGVGKTMFIRHLLRVDAKDVLEDAIVLYLNFGDEPALAEDLDSYVSSRLVEQLRDDYDIDIYDDKLVRATYNAEVNRFAKSVVGPLRERDPQLYLQREIEMLQSKLRDHGEHVRRSLQHIRGTTGRSIVVVLDNVDQRPPSFQDQVFLIGQGIASKWPATVFIALRPSTFRQSKQTGSLSGYHSRTFTVFPARTDAVVSKRLEFARRQLEETGRLESFPEGMSLSSSNLLAYVDVLIKAFGQDDKLKEMLDNLSGGNLRLALDLVNAFVGSGYVSTQRILDVAAAGRVYTIPLHEFFRAIAYGDAEYYDPASNPITNVLDISQHDGREHFLLSSLIVLAQRLGESRSDNGYVSVAELYDAATGWGFSQEQVGAQIGRALHGRMLEAPDSTSRYRVTSAGAYTVRKLLGMFTYIDAVVVDTPIVDAEARAAILDARPILERIQRARLFVSYLDVQWSACAGAGLALDWPVVSHELAVNIDSAERRAKQAVDRRSSNLDIHG